MEKWNKCKTFSATKRSDVRALGERITEWLREQGDIDVVDRSVVQSSDNEFHCISVVIFYAVK